MSSGASLEFVREEDFVEYFLFPNIKSAKENVESVKEELKNILIEVNNLIGSHISEYIWHKDEFQLTIRTPEQYVLIDEEVDKSVLPSHLYGITHYGDNIQDEWFIVYLLYEITRKIPGIVARVVDSDGEFLMIEAADVLPKWANPDTCEQRVYIHEGHLYLVQNAPTNTIAAFPVGTAIEKIIQNPMNYRVTQEVQNCIDERLNDFQNGFKLSHHRQTIRVPVAIAAILKEKPSLIAPACRVFYERDSIDLRACRAMRYFPPENRVRTSVVFTRCLYAMIKGTNYLPDRRTGWNIPAPGTEAYKEDLLGVKVACGFEILASQARKSDDLQGNRQWKNYLQSLINKDYFKENIEGSKDYVRLLDEAKAYYLENRDRFRTVPNVGKEVVTLLKNLDVNLDKLTAEETCLPQSEDDNWLNISALELDEMLTKKYGVNKMYGANGNVNAAEFTENVSEFLDRKSDFDGVENIESTPPEVPKRGIKKNKSMRVAVDDNSLLENGEKKSKANDISFDPDSFSTHVRNFLDFVIPEDNWESTSEMSDYEEDDDLDRNIEGMAQNSKMQTDLKTYMDQMDRELAGTTVGKTFQAANAEMDNFDDIESFRPIDINVNTLRSMMDSYRSQIGGSGPATNLLGAMGVGLRKDEAEEIPDLNGTQV